MDEANRLAEPERTRALFPREHGAYGQLLMPLATGLALGRPGAAALLIAYAFVVAFVAHESLLVLLGQRGRRALEGDGPVARRVLAILGVQALGAGGAGLVLAPAAARWAVVAPAVLVAAVAWLVVTRREKTIAGEITVGAALSSGGLVVALASGASLRASAAAWLTWVLAFAAATLAVQVVLERARSKGARDPGLRHLALVVALAASAFGAVPAAGLPLAAALALLPPAALAAAVCAAHLSARRLREVGWAMMGASVVTLAVLVAGLR
ncbi:MAG TPA: YwiC-like family protein [Anaeromyxobacteraceae bacterium]|nr:YwiC-like family protein [Anaeromyxobacteraceae bacterium]